MALRLGGRQDILRLVVGGRAEAEVGDGLIEGPMEMVAVLLLEADNAALDAEHGELLGRESAPDAVTGIVDDKTQPQDDAGGKFAAVVAETGSRHGL